MGHSVWNVRKPKKATWRLRIRPRRRATPGHDASRPQRVHPTRAPALATAYRGIHIMKAYLDAAVLAAIGCLQMIGDLSGQPAVRAIGAALQASPAPKVFTAQSGF